MMGSCKRLDGWKDLYLYNCSSDTITIETSISSIQFGEFGIFKTGYFVPEPIDTISYSDRSYFYEWLFRTKSYKETGVPLLIYLEPQEGMRIIRLEWLIAPTKFKERDLVIDSLRIITKSDTIFAGNRKEILELRFNKKCKDGIYFKTIKYGRQGEPVMSEKEWRGR